MAPASIKSLPIEIHTEILHVLLANSRRPAPISFDDELTDMLSSSPPPTRPVVLELIVKKGPPGSLFPFNVATVCKLWLDILAPIPECWTRVIFDVAYDHTPFQDALLWSKNQETVIEFTVFNSLGDSTVDHVTEARRVSAILEALQPHVHRCKSIIFDVTYSSSLPPPTLFLRQELPLLEELTLDCRIDDMERRTDAWMHPTGSDQEKFPTSFPRLEKLSLTGFWFMHLALHKPKWLNEVEFNYCPTIHVTRFAFLDRGFFTLAMFVYYISKIGASQSFAFSHLSLSYDHKDAPGQLSDQPYEFSCEHMEFDSVSKGFLSHFYDIVNLHANESQTFRNCEVPVVRQVHYGCELTLENIMDDNGRSLRNILGAWSGIHINISSCPSFNDTLISWLGTEVEYAYADSPPIGGQEEDDLILHYSNRFTFSRRGFRTFPAEGIEWLSVHDCSNFTSGTLREFIVARNNASIPMTKNGLLPKNGLDSSQKGFDVERGSMQSLYVTGKCPALGQDDAGWFETYFKDMSGCWGGDEQV
ncbi:hypothetical protein GALMADRAFT_257842 [Galerina marginata CBS 339.88]|uniref:F-box domain-containing protein n=1 Tax=Galerina marginata (strain CBS 339.88) TaxID=685588 RepID=A0A067S9N8_GALM3|nr:hypothetical protein GALMADRAFT_257842 [Galerina marginata CBS 339.88]